MVDDEEGGGGRGLVILKLGCATTLDSSLRSEVRVRNDFRFFTPLRAVRDDREGALRSG